jgi:hypothetical protein
MHPAARQAEINHEVEADAITDARDKLRAIAAACVMTGRGELLAALLLADMNITEMHDVIAALAKPN